MRATTRMRVENIVTPMRTKRKRNRKPVATAMTSSVPSPVRARLAGHAEFRSNFVRPTGANPDVKSSVLRHRLRDRQYPTAREDRALRLAPKDIRELRQHLRSRIICSGEAAQVPPLKMGNRFQHPTLTHRSLRGVSFNQLTGGASYRIAGGTRWTFLSQAKNVLKVFEQRPVRAVSACPTPVVRWRIDSGCTPWVIGAAPEHLAALVTHDIASTNRRISRRSVPRHRVTAGAVCEIREPAG